ncbi:hypothetical protein BV898_07541 [Hypsibius exemplaris]|uniref:Receptor ligand binding region domain-containing protein n=1 Tax=Hypsibius exemplaris TaxID=2072580 RepID=A0A1W0WT01_HYPEX|nr:hypothetical protein BV898_07541 [Hypsibius exemplaris]
MMAKRFGFRHALLTCCLCWESWTSMVGAVVPNFITLTSAGPTPSGFVELQPVFDVMLGLLAPKYPAVLANYTLKQLRHSTPGSCNEFEWYEQNREMNELFRGGYLLPRPTIVLAGEDGSLQNRDRFPSAISFAGGVIELYGNATVALFKRFNWTSVAVINDANTANPGMAKSREICRGAIESLQRENRTINLLLVPTDLSKEDPDRALLVAHNFTRIIVSCTFGATQRTLLAAAHALNMTNGDHVFIHLYVIETPGDSPLAWQKNDSLDGKVARAMLSTIIIRSPQIIWSRMDSTMSLIQKQKNTSFFGLFPNLTTARNEFQVSCAEAIEGAVTALNDSCTTSSEDCGSGKFLADHLLGRKFNFTSRTVDLTDEGVKVITAIIQQLSAVDLEIKDIFRYDSDVKQLMPDAKNQFSWLMNGKPPPDRPLCGLHQELCPDNRTTVAISVAFVGCGILAAVAFLL